MLTKRGYWWQQIRASFWFIPAVLVLEAVVLALVLVTLDATVDLHVVERWPLVFGAGAGGARGLLTAVASSMITVAGLVFSITLVALSLASSQYTSRVISNFMRDRVNQTVLGVFVGIFAYCLVVLRTIREGNEITFVPSLAVIVGLILAFVGIAFLIYFIHHISVSIQASTIIAETAAETITAVDHQFPDQLEQDENESADSDLSASLANQSWSAVPARKSGYLVTVDMAGLVHIAREHGRIVRMERGVGEFVVEETPLVSMLGRQVPDDLLTERLNAVYVISNQRTVEQDAAFGIRQLVDIAMKALSPGVNDTTTAVICVDYLTAILARLATRRIGNAHRLDQLELRVIARGMRFEDVLAEAFDQIRQNASGNVAILSRLLSAMQTIASQTTNPARRRVVLEKVQWIAELAERTIESPYDRERFDKRLVRVRQELVSRHS